LENGSRGFANLGLNQTFKWGEHWSFSGSLERSQTVTETGFEAFDSDVPLTTGNALEDFTATAIGVAFNRNGISATARVENRLGDDSTSWGAFLSVLKEHGERTSYAVNFELFFDDRDHGSQREEARLRFSLAHRPDDSDWILLDRLELGSLEDVDSTFRSQTRKVVNHFKANHLMTRKIQVAYQFSAKYVVDTINGQDYDTIGALLGLEARYNFIRNWDFSFHARARHTFEEDLTDSNVGVSLGHSVIKNIWVSIGYNFTGFYDDEFSSGEYTNQGPFVRFRANLDQNTVRDFLNRFRSK